MTETASLVQESGGSCLAHELDVTDAASVERFFTAAEREFGTVTAVINNAATARYGPMDDFSPEEIEVEIATKLIGALYMALVRVRPDLEASADLEERRGILRGSPWDPRVAWVGTDDVTWPAGDAGLNGKQTCQPSAR